MGIIKDTRFRNKATDRFWPSSVGPSSSSADDKDPLLPGGQDHLLTTTVRHSNSTGHCRMRSRGGFILGLSFITFTIIGVILVRSRTEGCAATPDPKITPHSSSNEDSIPDLEKSIKTKMLSISLKHIVNYILQTSQDFQNFTTCPAVPGVFEDKLDCRRYYVCDKQGHFTEEWCLQNQGFDKIRGKCVDRNDVQLCSSIQVFDGYSCPSIGLYPYKGDCNKFIVCTKRGIAFTGECLTGEFFHAGLSLCLPNDQVDC